jgi:hypothetical protein
MAVWLVDEERQASFVIALPPTDSMLEPNRFYVAQEFSTALEPSARRRLVSADRP